MVMQLSAMKEFLVLAQRLNFLTASEELYISQATLSRHIKDLEKELGMPLFRRSTRKVELTPFGIRMIPFAKRAVALDEDIAKSVEDYKEQVSNHLTVGLVPHWDRIDFGRLIAGFRRQYPGIHISIVSRDSADLLKMLEDETCHFALIRAASKPTESSVPICDDPLYAFLPASHPLAGRSSLSPKDLAGESFLLGGDGELSYELALAACREAGVEPQVLYHGAGPQQLYFLTQGIGVSIMFEGPMLDNQSAVVRIPLETSVMAKIYLVYRPETLHDAGRALLEFLLQYKF